MVADHPEQIDDCEYNPYWQPCATELLQSSVCKEKRGRRNLPRLKIVNSDAWSYGRQSWRRAQRR
jgi:hypothetical protein